MVMINLDSLIQYAGVQGVYCLIDEPNMRIWINTSTNILDAIYRDIMTYKHAKHPLRGFPLQINIRLLKRVKNPLNLRFVAKKFHTLFKQHGFEVVSKNSVSRWRPKIEMINDFRGKQQILFTLRLMGPRKKSVYVACYASEPELKAFMKKHYRPMTEIIYATNSLTKRFLKQFDLVEHEKDKSAGPKCPS